MKSRLCAVVGVVLVAFSASACTTAEQRTAGYGVGGAALGGLAGAAIGGNSRSALAGAAIGGVGGTLVGAANSQNAQPSAPGPSPYQYCNYTDPYGRPYQAPCSYQ